MKKQEVRSRIEEVGIIPAIRVSSSEDALFAAEAVSRGGIPIVEVTLTVPDAHKVIAHLVQNAPEVIVGAGGVSDVETARRCLDAGAKFLTSDGLDPEVVIFAMKEGVVVIPGTLTPSEVMRAWQIGSRLRESRSLRASGWRQLHPGVEGDVSKRAPHRRRRSESADGIWFHSCGCDRARHRRRANSQGGDPAASIGPHHRVGAEVYWLRQRCPQAGIGPVEIPPEGCSCLPLRISNNPEVVRGR